MDNKEIKKDVEVVDVGYTDAVDFYEFAYLENLSDRTEKNMLYQDAEKEKGDD